MRFTFLTNDEILAINKEVVEYWYNKVKGNKAMYVYEYVAKKCGCTARTAMKYIAMIRRDKIKMLEN